VISYNTGEKGDWKWTKNKVRGVQIWPGVRGSSVVESYPLKEKRSYIKKKQYIFLSLYIRYLF
jgi:hypothetical protein